MTDRERWTVYPLLFLTLGVAMRDKIFEVVNVDNVQCKRLLCNTLVVTDQKGKQQLVVSSNAAGVQCKNLICNALVVADQQGTQQVVVSSNEAGGIVQTVGNSGRPDIIVGHTKQLSGLLFVDAGGKVLPGTIAVPVAVQPNPQPDDTPDAETDDTPAESSEP